MMEFSVTLGFWYCVTLGFLTGVGSLRIAQLATPDKTSTRILF
jgi:hypothetical protein